MQEPSSVGASIEKAINPLLSSSDTAVSVDVIDKARLGAAAAIARQLLEILLLDIKSLEERNSFAASTIR